MCCQAHLRRNAYEDAVEYCNRALFIDAKNVKALFRRALAHKACARFSDALTDLAAAAVIEPANEDITKERRLCEVPLSTCDA